jgi:hypothetical protein
MMFDWIKNSLYRVSTKIDFLLCQHKNSFYRVWTKREFLLYQHKNSFIVSGQK